MGGTSTSIGGCDIDVADCLCGGVVDAEDCLRCLRGGVVDVEDCLRMFVKSMGASLSIVGVTGRLDWVLDWLHWKSWLVVCFVVK
jgi:hypothetical protein